MTTPLISRYPELLNEVFHKTRLVVVFTVCGSGGLRSDHVISRTNIQICRRTLL